MAINSSGNAVTEIYSSVFNNNGNNGIGGFQDNSIIQGTTQIDCIMAHETSSFTGTNIFLQDPNFIDRNNRDYHLSSSSLAIDVCDNNFAGLQFKDIDFQSRGMDNINIANINGPYDIGADETAGIDVMFKDGFE